MIPNKRFANKRLEFWANIKLISQKLGYSDRKTKDVKARTLLEIINAYEVLGMNPKKLHNNNSPSAYGKNILDYFKYRAEILNNHVKPNLMNKEDAKICFDNLRDKFDPKCPLPHNKQKGAKRTFAYFTCIINMLIENSAKNQTCDYNPMQLITISENDYPLRVLSRRVDGAFPTIHNPVAIWEIKEYYNTTTFGSRVADGVYETILDGMELKEVRKNTNCNILHYLMIDDYYTWWTLGKSYLCRIIDILHMGIITEVLFGKEVIDRIPKLVTEWKHNL